MKKFKYDKLFLTKLQLCELGQFLRLVLNELRYGKPASSIYLWHFYSDFIFFVDHYSAGVSNKHCLLLFHWYCFIIALCNVFKDCKNDNF